MTLCFTEDFKSDFNSEFWNIIRMGIYWKFSCFCLFIGSLFICLFVQQASVSLKRLQDFLNLEELDLNSVQRTTCKISCSPSCHFKIIIQ